MRDLCPSRLVAILQKYRFVPHRQAAVDNITAAIIYAGYAFGQDSDKDLYNTFLNCSLTNATCDFDLLNVSINGLQSGIDCYLALTNVSDELKALLSNLSSANEVALNASDAGDCAAL